MKNEQKKIKSEKPTKLNYNKAQKFSLLPLYMNFK